MSKFFFVWLAILCFWLPGLAQAHQQGNSYSAWSLGKQPAVSLRVSELDLTRLALHRQYSANYELEVIGYAQSHLSLWQGDRRCQPLAAELGAAQAGWLLLSWSFDCPSATGTEPESWLIDSQLLLAEAPSHLHFARLQQSEKSIDRVLSSRSPQWQVQSQTMQASGLLNYLSLGVLHIWEGWDHLAFLLGLLLLASRLSSLLWLVSGFTLGHSLTLAAATLSWIQPDMALIEACIAWSIALLASEYFWKISGQRRWCLLPLVMLALFGFSALPFAVSLGLALFSLGYFLALQSKPQYQAQTRVAVSLAFGLIHGCGFAAVLAEVGLAPANLFSSLLGFNLGVELGQLLVLLLAWPLLRWLLRQQPQIGHGLATSLLGLASFWWFLRLL